MFVYLCNDRLFHIVVQSELSVYVQLVDFKQPNISTCDFGDIFHSTRTTKFKKKSILEHTELKSYQAQATVVRLVCIVPERAY